MKVLGDAAECGEASLWQDVPEPCNRRFHRLGVGMARTPIVLTVIAALALTAGEASARPKKKKTPEPAPATAPLTVPAPPPPPAIPSLASLVSASEDQVKAKLGVPDIARREGASAMWTYAWPDCALLVYFKSPDGRTLRVSGASAGPRKRGQPVLSVDACIAQNHGRPRGEGAESIDALLAAPG
jgi:hypothetical protein